MIVEILIGAGVIAAGAAAARAMVRRRAAMPDGEDGGPGPEDVSGNGRSAQAGPRGLLVGDVLLYADSELWLAGRIDLDEEGFVARVFSSPGGHRSEFVLQLDEEATDLATMSETVEVPDGPVPESLPVAGRRLELEARGTADVRKEGEHLPRTTDRASYAILSDVGGRVLLVVDFVKGPRLALVGQRVNRHMVDLLPGGDLEA